MLQGARGRYERVRLGLLRIKAWVYAAAVLGLLTVSSMLGGVFSHPTPSSTVAFAAAAGVLGAFLIRGRDRMLAHGIVGGVGLGTELLPLGNPARAVLITVVAVLLIAWLADDDETTEQPELTTPAVVEPGS